ncbi:MAG: FtsQ-type POTRA domain-containing protein [Actinobacteria bacterium]|nr:FtsQ-type POTRA domain-containing protein [Actinomycetota bacterium]
MDPRIRARRIEVNRKRGRRRLHILMALVLITALVVLAWVVVHSPILEAEHVVVKGNVHTPTSEILAVSGLDTHPALLTMNSARMVARIESLPWVAHAALERSWPSGVVVTVKERTAVAELRDGPGWAEVDITGRVLTEGPSAVPGLVRLYSPGATTYLAPGKWLPSTFRPALKAAAALPRSLLAEVAAFEPAPGRAVDMILTSPGAGLRVSGVTVELGSVSQLQAKYEAVATLLARVNLAGVRTIDVSDPFSPTTSTSA